MTSRRRNGFIILVVIGLLAASAVAIASKPTRLGLDLQGGIELVYQGRPTPKVPEVTPEAIDDALETIRKRTDALGVSEPEIQRAGSDQISVGLPDVADPRRAEEQVGTTAQLQFYDWEASLLSEPNAPIEGLFKAVEEASKERPTADEDDLPPDGANADELRRAGVDPSDTEAVHRFYDRQNDTTGDKYYLFGPGNKPIGELDSSCEDLLAPFEDRLPRDGSKPGEREPPKGSECREELRALGTAGPPEGSHVIRVPRGILVVKAEAPRTDPGAEVDRWWVIEDDSELSGAEIKDPEQNFDQRTQEPIVTMNFTDTGRKAFHRVTQRLAQRGAEQILPPGTPRETAFQRFAITLDNQIVSLATIDFVENPDGIDGRTGAQINNIGNIQETQDLARNLRIGALPIELKLISKTQVSATLGKQALEQGLLAGGAGLALTLLFLLSFYRVLGVIAGLALVTYGVLLFALVKLIPITLTLPGIAGLILTLGVAADSNIVIFERIKEEVRAGRSIPAAISTGYRKALATIIDANVATFGVAFILFMLATAGVKGFAFTLGIGILVSLFTAVVLTSAVLGLMSRTRVMGTRAALGAGRARHFWRRFDFVGASKWFFSSSGLILVIGALAIAGLGINFGIDFESGTRITTPLDRDASVAEVREALPSRFRDSKIQEVDDPGLGENVVQISTAELEPEEVREVQAALNEEIGLRAADFSSQSIGPTFGQQVARTAVIAVIASLLLISLYIGMRFEAKFAVPVLIALTHDVLITAGVYALTGRQVTTATVAAMLTILGYSIYDTIIVFDRIRENVPRMPRAAFSQIVNRSMSEVLSRSLATTLSTLLPVGALFLFGGETLKDFAFALIVGVISGTYSSIFIASPVLTLWKEREPVYRRRRRMALEEYGGTVPAYAGIALGDGAPDGAPDEAPDEAPKAAAEERTAGDRLTRRERRLKNRRAGR